MNKEHLSEKRIVFLIALMLFAFGSIYLSIALPAGPTVTYNYTENATPRSAAAITTAGGSFTTIVLNGTTQTPRWKAYVGNVTGRLTLDDAANYSIYDWLVTSLTGEVYASRNDTITWTNVNCSNSTIIQNEQTALNLSNSNDDSINKTFINRIHKTFYVGSVLIRNSTCPAIATYVNDTNQTLNETAKFQEVLIADTSQRMIYSSLIFQNTTGYNNRRFDFQMIVAEDEYATNPTPYYFWIELV